MPLLTLLRAEGAVDVRRLVFLAVVAAFATALILPLVNSAAHGPAPASVNLRLAFAFAIAVAIYTISQRFLLSESARQLEAMFHRIRTRLVDAIRQSDLAQIEAIGEPVILNAVSAEIQSLARSCNVLVPAGQQALLVVFSTCYLFVISPPAFVLAVAFMVFAAVLYRLRFERMNAAIAAAHGAETAMQEIFAGFLDGFKEVKLNRRRGAALTEDAARSSQTAGDARAAAQLEFQRSFLLTQNMVFVLLGIMVFVVPLFDWVSSTQLAATTTAVLFVIAPISSVLSSVPVLANANAAASRVVALEHELAVLPRPALGGELRGDAPRTAFSRIELRDVVFRFPNGGSENPFQVGPIDLRIQAGETVFISGGNGSGKSTFMRLLTALYWPQEGSIALDGIPVTHANAESYRALFSSVFTEYHLFKRLYGIEPAAHDEVPVLLDTFEIAGKTSVAAGDFTTLDLSAGQRKRVALIVAVLERRPICVLDEWAADQDVIFRRKFYREILTLLKERGITVIAVSHDDRYYDLADRRIHMEYGRIVSDTKETIHA